MSDSTDDEQRPAHLYKPGQSGNPAGRPKGSRNKLSEFFIETVYADFVEHGPAVVEKVRLEDPVQYMRVVAGIIPKELKIERSDELTDSELDQRIRQLAGIIGVEVGISRTSGAEEASEGSEQTGGVSTLQ
jgi:hypothetical protein